MKFNPPARMDTPLSGDVLDGKVVAESVVDGDPKELLIAILRYYQRTQGVGHTRSLFSGLGYVDPGQGVRPKVIVHQAQFGRMLSPGNYFTLNELATTTARAPIIWDNAALAAVCQSALARICALEDELAVVRAAEAATVVDVEDTNLLSRPRNG